MFLNLGKQIVIVIVVIIVIIVIIIVVVIIVIIYSLSLSSVIYAGAQKNLGCAGVTLVIVREDLISAPSPICPVVLEYKSQATNQSIYNTPPVWNVYVMGEVFKWIQERGGVMQMEKLSQKKSEIIYKVRYTAFSFVNSSSF